MSVTSFSRSGRGGRGGDSLLRGGRSGGTHSRSPPLDASSSSGLVGNQSRPSLSPSPHGGRGDSQLRSSPARGGLRTSPPPQSRSSPPPNTSVRGNRVRLCRDGNSCANPAACGMTHPALCDDGDDCEDEYCDLMHSAPRPPVCRFGLDCFNTECERRHPPERLICEYVFVARQLS